MAARRGVPARWDRLAALAFGVLGAAALVLARHQPVYLAILLSTAVLLPLVVVAAVVACRGSRDGFEVFGVAAAASLFALVQFPLAHPIYSAYLMPLVVLLVLYVAVTGHRSGREQPWRALLVAGIAYAVLGAAVLGPASDVLSRERFVPASERSTAILGLPRAAGLAVTQDEKEVYEAVVADIEAHSAPGDPIWAGPESPQIYFLAARRNPTRTFHEVLGGPEGGDAGLLATLDEEKVAVIVVNSNPQYTPLSPALAAELRARFPHAIDRDWFVVRWRDQ